MRFTEYKQESGMTNPYEKGATVDLYASTSSTTPLTYGKRRG